MRIDPSTELIALLPVHLEPCLALDRDALGGLWNRQQWQKELEDEGRPGVGVRRRGQLLALACGWLIVDELHVTAVAVASRQRRQGLGRRVLAALLVAGRAAGARRATLEVAAGNAAARALYESCGFREAGVRRGYYRNGDDALIQWANLDAVDRFG